MAKTLFILNDPPYGTERDYNALRLAASLAKREGEDVKVFLIGDAASGAKSGQNVPHGYYSVEGMIGVVVRHRGTIGVCGSCMDARGIRENELVAGTHRSSMDELTDWTLAADRVVTF